MNKNKITKIVNLKKLNEENEIRNTGHEQSPFTKNKK